MIDLAAGIDIGGTNTVFGLVDAQGRIHGSGTIKTSSFKDVEEFVSALYNNISEEALRKGNVRLTGFGIGAPMGNINKGSIEHAAGLPWKGIIHLADIFRKHTALSVIVTNDANAAAIGEMVFGDAKAMTDFIVITLGTGLGSGIVVNGRLVYGHDGFAGELGHTSAGHGFADRECGCGKMGCLETYVSATGLKRTLIHLLADDLQQCSLRNVSFNDLTSEMIYNAATEGDKIAMEAFRLTGNVLGASLADFVAVTSPEAIFLFGGVARAGKMLFDPVRESMEMNLLNIYRGKVKLLPSGLEAGNAAVLGAGSLVWSGNLV